MTDVRVFVPATVERLAEWYAAGELRPATAHAVTPELRAAWQGADVEELEYGALLAAAAASADLVRAGTGARRRVVVAADVAASSVGPADGTEVELTRPVPLRAVAAVHADDEAGSAALAVGRESEHELLWYAPQELNDVLASGIGSR